MFCDILSDGDDAKDGRRHHDYRQEGLMLSRSQVLPISFDEPLSSSSRTTGLHAHVACDERVGS
jgi:hypothetical protein